jgi:hypothetical protein
MITLTFEEVLKLRPGDIIYHRVLRNADGTPQRYKINGRAKLWKTKPWKIRVPLKHGLYWYGYLTEGNLNCFSLTEEEAG